MHDLILAALLVAALAGVATTATGIVACHACQRVGAEPAWLFEIRPNTAAR